MRQAGQTVALGMDQAIERLRIDRVAQIVSARSDVAHEEAGADRHIGSAVSSRRIAIRLFGLK